MAHRQRPWKTGPHILSWLCKAIPQQVQDPTPLLEMACNPADASQLYIYIIQCAGDKATITGDKMLQFFACLDCEQASLIRIIEAGADDDALAAQFLLRTIKEDVLLLVCGDEVRLQCLSNLLVSCFILQPQLYLNLHTAASVADSQDCRQQLSWTEMLQLSQNPTLPHYHWRSMKLLPHKGSMFLSGLYALRWNEGQQHSRARLCLEVALIRPTHIACAFKLSAISWHLKDSAKVYNSLPPYASLFWNPVC